MNLKGNKMSKKERKRERMKDRQTWSISREGYTLVEERII